MTSLTDPIYTDANKAREHFEAIYWPNGPVCSHCGTVNEATLVKGKSHRAGLYQCNACRKPFTVTTGSVMESSHVPLNKWALGFHLYAASKKGFSAHQLHRSLGITYKSAWFMAHRIREAMRDLSPAPLGGEGKTVEADETFIGGKEKNKHARKRTKRNIGGTGKEIAFSLVERGGKIRSRHVAEVSAATLRPILVAQIDAKSFLVTDDAGQYRHMKRDFPTHQTVNHGIGEYVRGEAHSNTVEGYFSILKRGITGVYHHVSQQHLKRYLAEFDFRYNERAALGVDDLMRTMRAIKGAQGKRLTYNQSRPVKAAA